jgi:lysophospholipase L1-like esterase
LGKKYKEINDIELISPKKCFLMIDINDVFGGKSAEEIIKNYKIIISYLKQNNVEIIIQSVLNISELAKDSWGYDTKKINSVVIEVNKRLKNIAEEENVRYADINSC